MSTSNGYPDMYSDSQGSHGTTDTTSHQLDDGNQPADSEGITMYLENQTHHNTGYRETTTSRQLFDQDFPSDPQARLQVQMESAGKQRYEIAACAYGASEETKGLDQ
jgi:hypothetical protein